MNKIIILIIISMLFLFVFQNDAIAGYAQQSIEVIQSESNIYVEIGKWVGGLTTVLAGVGLTYYLNKKRRND